MCKAFGGLGWLFSHIEVIVFTAISMNPSFAIDKFDLLKRSVCSATLSFEVDLLCRTLVSSSYGGDAIFVSDKLPSL